MNDCKKKSKAINYSKIIIVLVSCLFAYLSALNILQIYRIVNQYKMGIEKQSKQIRDASHVQIIADATLQVSLSEQQPATKEIIVDSQEYKAQQIQTDQAQQDDEEDSQEKQSIQLESDELSQHNQQQQDKDIVKKQNGKTGANLSVKVQKGNDLSKLSYKQLLQLQKNNIQLIQQIKQDTISEEQRKKNINQRVRMGQPKKQQRKIKIWIIKGSPRGSHCAVMNAVNLLTPVSIQTIKQLIQRTKLGNVIVITDRLDQFAEQLLHLNFNKKYMVSYNFSVDADYKFIYNPLNARKCNNIIYLSHNFAIEAAQADNLKQHIDRLLDFNVLFSQTAVIQNQSTILANLSTADLSSLPGSQFNKKYLKIISPLNYGFYSRYTIQQLIIYPILALASKSHYLIGFNETVHRFNQSIVQFKEFGLTSPLISQQDYNLFCFVSYPSNPFTLSLKQTQRYLQSLYSIQTSGAKISMILFLPLNFNQSEQQQFRMLLDFLHMNHKIEKAKIVLKLHKAVSSLSCYQAAYTYCETASFIISSRHNVQFKPNILTALRNSISTKFHYYTSNFYSQGKQVKMNLDFSLASFSNYQEKLIHVQMFKKDLFKSNYFWSLKSGQLEFYQTQLSFVYPMLQLINFSILTLNQTLYSVQSRNQLQAQSSQLETILKYRSYKVLPNNMLQPIQYNCLNNQAFRRNASKLIPKIFHLVNLKSDSNQLQSTRKKEEMIKNIKLTNPEFFIQFWNSSNLNEVQFPISFALAEKLIELSSPSNQFMVVAETLIRYQAVYNKGGISLPTNCKILKQMNQFLNYELFSNDFVARQTNFESPSIIKTQIFGAVQHSYYLKIVLTEIVRWPNIESIKGQQFGYHAMRRAVNDEQLFTVVGFGFHLFQPANYQIESKQAFIIFQQAK